MGTIVVGYDGSECAGSALTSACELARELGDRVVVAYAAEPPYRSLGDELAEHRRALEEIGERSALLRRRSQAPRERESTSRGRSSPTARRRVCSALPSSTALG
jgi:hypothetical protein